MMSADGQHGMTFTSATEALLQIEDELDLFEQTINGVYFWERIRFPVHRRILEDLGLVGQAHTNLEATFSNHTTKMLLATKNLLFRNPFFCSPKNILFFGHQRRKLQEDGNWWDLYCDPIIDTLNNSYNYFETAYRNRHFTPAKTNNIHYLDFPLFAASLRRKIGTVSVSLTRVEKQLTNKIRETIVIRLGVQLPLVSIITNDLLERKSTLPFYRRLLNRGKPKLLIVVCSYGRETFIEACKELHIPVIELQHGVINRYHLGYHYPGRNRRKRSFPDYFFAFGDYWKHCVEFPIKKDRVYTIGYPYLESETSKYVNLPKKDQIVFISQGTVGKEMSKFAAKLSKDSLDQTIVYKLHPGEYGRWREHYPWLLNTDIEVIEDDSVPLYQIFAESKAQVGVASTAIYEGLSFGLKTFLLDLPGVEYMQDLVEKDYAEIIGSVDELLHHLNSPESAPQLSTDEFFRSNALENTYKAIHEIMALGQANS